MATIKQGDLTGLSDGHAAFVCEFIKDYNAALAAERSGFSRAHGNNLRNREDIDRVIAQIMQRRLESACIDADWHLLELVDNHLLARQQGKLSASNQALVNIGKHAAVDSYSAEKVHIVGDEEVRAALERGRKRAASNTLKEGDPAPDFTQPQDAA